MSSKGIPNSFQIHSKVFTKFNAKLFPRRSKVVPKSLKNHYKKKYRLSITVCDKIFICNNINDEDIIIKEFDHYDQASSYIDNNFTKIKEGWNYNYYVKKQERII